MKKFLFDLDGTITRVETLPIIARQFGISEDIELLTKQTIDGEISFVDSFKKRVELMKDLPVDEVANLLENVPLHEKILEFIKKNSDRCSIVTGNLDVWIDPLCRKIGCEYFSSVATVENNRVKHLDSILRKDLIVKKFQRENYFVVYIGDGDNDFDAMFESDISIANEIVHAVPSRVKKIADHIVETEIDLCRILNDI